MAHMLKQQISRTNRGLTAKLHRPSGYPELSGPSGLQLAVVVAAALVCLPQAATAAEWDFEPRIALGQTWTDNVALAEDGLEESEWITELRPGFTLLGEGPRASAEIDYEMQILRFNDFDELDDVYNQMTATGNVEVLPETTFIDAFARYDQQNVDTEGRVAFSNLFDTGNRTDYLVFGASPYHVGTWGNWGESLVRYTYHGIRYSNTDPVAVPPEDSDTSEISGTLGSPENARGLSWRTSGSYTRTDFEDAEEFKYARVLLDLGMPVSPRTRLIGTVGQESDVEEDPSKGGLDEAFWLVGFIWEPSDLQSLEVRGGDRFYGTAWEAHWRRRGSKGELSVDYTEDPTTSSGVLGDDDIFLPGFPTIDVGSLDTRVFLQKRLSGRATYEFTRSLVTARLYSDRREYLDLAGGDEESYGATLSFDWDAFTRTRIGTTLNWEERDFESGRRDEYGELNVRVSREINRTLSGELRLSHFLRNSNTEEDYSANLISLFLTATF